MEEDHTEQVEIDKAFFDFKDREILKTQVNTILTELQTVKKRYTIRNLTNEDMQFIRNLAKECRIHSCITNARTQKGKKN